MEKSFEEKYNILSTKIANIRDVIPIGWFDEQNNSALAEAVACPGYCLDWIEIYVKDLLEENLRLHKDNFQQNEEIAKLWDRI